jgi:hypothetical protein
MATRGQKIFAFSMLGWSSALFVHGIFAFARPRTPPPAVMPVAITSERGELIGVGLGGTF